MQRLALPLLLALLFLAPVRAADTWKEVRSAHFTMWSLVDDGRARELLWQMEQVRSAIGAMWPWMRPDLTRPFVVIAAKDEKSMKAIVPGYFEKDRNVKPTSVWLSAPDRIYVAIRGDLRGDDRALVNPFQTAYFSYASIVLQNSFESGLPEWLHRGFAGLLSNTIVRRDFVAIGAPIPQHLRELRSSGRLRLRELVATADLSKFDGVRLYQYDAQSWAFVHMLMFGNNGAYRDRFNRYVALLRSGRADAAALDETLGPVEQYEEAFANYLKSELLTYGRATVDAAVEGEKFPVRVMPAAESAALLAAFHAGMGRPVEARAMIDAARGADPQSAEAYAAEGLLLDAERKPAEARAAYAKAAELGTSNGYALYRMAILSWQAEQPDGDTLRRMEAALERAVAININCADAYAYLARVRSALGQDESKTVPLVRRAIALEPRDPWHRITAASVLARAGKHDDARKEAQAALTLAGSDERARAEAQRLLDWLASASRR